MPYRPDTTGTLARLWLHLSRFEFDVVPSAAINNRAGDKLLKLEKAETVATKIRDEFPEMMESIAKLTWKMNKNGHEEKSDYFLYMPPFWWKSLNEEKLTTKARCHNPR